MSTVNRRQFLKRSALAGAGAAVLGPATARVLGANDTIRLAVVGVGGQGGNHVNYFQSIPGVQVVALCDADSNHAEEKARLFKNKYNAEVKTYLDVRDLLEDNSIDGITTATPNHWHSLVTIWACQAGKDVYVEKPVSHEIWEGRKMIEAARRYNRIVQTGTQKRSDEGLIEAFAFMREGNLGAIRWARGFCYKPRGSIGLVNGPQPVPETCNYNLWCGPADMHPLHRQRLHYDWHWVWNTGNGDIGNQGIHEMDLARWALGQNQLAPRVFSIGGRFGYEDDANTPNTLISYFDYQPAPLIFEVRGLPRKKGDNAMDHYRGTRIGVVVQCEDGYFVGGGGGGWVYDNNGQKIRQFRGEGGGGHHENFIKAVRSRKVSDLNADIVEGHLSSSLCHMGNISYRIGKQKSVDAIRSDIGDNAEMQDSFNRFLEHMEANEVDLTATPATIGPMLSMNAATERFSGEHSNWANMYLKRNYREPFVVPDKV